jgi:hypothetical protein
MSSEELEDRAREMFLTPGWDDFIEECETMMQQCHIDNCNSAEELWFQKGRLAVLKTILSYEAFVKTTDLEQDWDSDPVYN